MDFVDIFTKSLEKHHRKRYFLDFILCKSAMYLQFDPQKKVKDRLGLNCDLNEQQDLCSK